MAAQGKVDIVGIRTWGVAGRCAMVAVALGIWGSQQAGWAEDVGAPAGDEAAVVSEAIEGTAPVMNIPELISQLTLEEKAGMCSGRNFWFTKEVKRLNIPGL